MNYSSDKEAIDGLKKKSVELFSEFSKVVYGQDEIIRQVLI